MPYHSPLHLFADLNLPIDGSTLDKQALSLARKMLLAEIDLSSTQSIKRGSVELSKNDVLNLFEDLKNNGNLSYHQAIFQDHALLHFLEQFKLEIPAGKVSLSDMYSSKTSNYTRFAENALYKESSFLTFVSPFFREAYQTIIQRAIEKQDRNTMMLVSKNARFMTSSEEYQAFSRIMQQLKGKEDIADELQTRIETGQVYTSKEVSFCSSANFIDCLNFLPDTFESFRDIYSVSLINIGVVLHNRKRYDLAQSVISNAHQLKVSSHYRSQLERYYKELVLSGPQSAYTNTETSAGGSNISWTTIFIIIGIVLRILLMGEKCNRHSDYPSYENNYNNIESITSNDFSTSNGVISSERKVDSAFQWIAYHLKDYDGYQIPQINKQDLLPLSYTDVKEKYANRIKQPANGAAIYTNIFKNNLFKSETVAGKNLGDTTTLYLNNDTDEEAIVLVNTPNLIYTSDIPSYAKYIAPHEKITLQVSKVNCNRIYFYFGRHWNPAIKISSSVNKWGSFKYKLNGGFMKLHPKSTEFLSHPLDIFPLNAEQIEQRTLDIKYDLNDDDLRIYTHHNIKMMNGKRSDFSICEYLYPISLPETR